MFAPTACAWASAFVTSDKILPSFSSMIRSPYSSAKSRSCDTTITSFVFESFFNVSNTCLPVFESSAPVGSSAMMISGCLISARAIAIRCFCPPESVFGLRFANEPKSTSSKSCLIAFLSFGLPCSSSASAMLSSTVNSFKILYSWNTNPINVFR